MNPLIDSKTNINEDFLAMAIKQNKLCRAYLFAGNNLEEKLRLIKFLNQSLNCKNPQTRPCQECNSCKWIEKDEHPKTPIWIKAEKEGKEEIKIKQIQDLLQELSFNSPYSRIIVIEQANAISKEAAAALLKCTEDARPGTYFIYLTENSETLLSTIKSRCQILNFDNKASRKHIDNSLRQELIKIIYEDELSQLINCEKLSKSEYLQEILEDLEEDCAEKLSENKNYTKAIEQIEKCLEDLRLFVKPKNALYDLVSGLKLLELTL